MDSKDIYNKLYNEYFENKLSHAFLFVTNNINQCNNDLKNLIKKISCNSNYSEKCDEKCNICHLIDNNELSDLIIINPESNVIKKETIINLKTNFNTKSNYIKKKVYIINQADKMNLSSANSLLKFFEEPSSNIIGFLITSNKDKLLSTIISRCEVINVNYDVDSIILTDDEREVIDQLSYNMILDIEFKSLADNLIKKSLYIDKLDTREKLQYLFNKINWIYSGVLNGLGNDEISQKIFSNNSVIKLVKKLKIIDNINGCLNYNVNVELIMDKYLIEMVEANE